MLLFVFSIFVSAFLLFQVQPIIARYILPWYGGSPAVWTTCMLFFQVGLLAGYGYAHLLASTLRQRPKWQLGVHLILVLLAVLFLPITPDEAKWKPVGGGDTSDVLGIIKLLAFTVGLPYAAISASGPLLQHWFAGACPGKSPYRLYAVSNLGSLLGLISYPFLVEPALGLHAQTRAWSGGFAVYAVLAIACAWLYCRAGGSRVGDGDLALQEDAAPPGLRDRLLWVILPACGSAMMLSITNEMCQDVAVVPFLWILPLSLYLVTFIIAFDREVWYNRYLWIPLALIGTTLLVYLINHQAADGYVRGFWPVALLNKIFSSDEIHLYIQIGIFMLALFALCMVCHGEMTRRKPAPKYLTSFYLLVSLGGALGGVLVSLIAPRIFDGYWELHFLLMFVVLIVGLLISGEALAKYRNPVWGGAGTILTIQAAVFLFLGLRAHYREGKLNTTASMRSFHGVIRVYEGNQDTPDHFRSMFHGRITHGRQYLNPEFRNIPTTYYGEDSGVGALLKSLPQRQSESNAPIRIGVVGLGSGSLAVHAREGDSIVFYEINPQVEQLARSHFTYLDDCQGTASVVLGDARTSLEEELADGVPRKFDALFVDAFSGDSIPVHLLTKEAFEIYFQHIREDGALITHITNLHIDLSDPVRQLAEEFGRQSLLVIHSPEEDDYHLYYSEWVIITKNQEIVDRLYEGGWVNEWTREEPKEIHWTDDYSNLLQVIMTGE